MKVKEFKNKHKEQFVSLYYTECKTVDVMDETLIDINEIKVYEGKAKSIPIEHDNKELITAYPVFDVNHKIECAKMFI